MKNVVWIYLVMLCCIIACDQKSSRPDESNQSFIRSEEPEMSQPEMVRIEGGKVEPFGNGEAVDVKPFYLDKHLVTYEQYNQFIKASGYKDKKYWSEAGRKFLEKYEFWVPSTYHEEYLNRQALPVTGVSWYEAEAYANWRGVRLPTAAEWSLACHGNGESRRYPWGDEFDFEAIDYRARLAPYPVGSREKNISPAGVIDLVGNVWQWCADTYEGKDFRLEAEPTGAKPGTNHILRGGGWMSLRRHFTTDYLYYDKPFHRLATYGFRCAKDAE